MKRGALKKVESCFGFVVWSLWLEKVESGPEVSGVESCLGFKKFKISFSPFRGRGVKRKGDFVCGLWFGVEKKWKEAPKCREWKVVCGLWFVVEKVHMPE